MRRFVSPLARLFARAGSVWPRLAALALGLLASAAALGLAGCTTSSNAGNPDASVIATCSSDAECGAGFKCDRDSRQCVCTGDEACPSGKFCNAFTGLCVDSVPGCTSDGACKQGEYCDRALRSCKPVTAVCGKCRADAECGPRSKCAVNPTFPTAGSYCSPTCAAGDAGPGACPGGLVCNAVQLCVPAQGACGVNNACVPDTLAVCTKDTDCTSSEATQLCDTQLGACVAKNRVCPSGDACDPQQHVCVHSCAADTDCKLIEGTAGYRCRNNACFQLATCNADAECSSVNKQICAPNPDGSKSCKAGCVSPTDCPLGQGCNNDPQHPRCTPSCAQNSDCPLNAVCNAGACRSSFGGCTQACQATAACAVGASCSPNGCCVGGAYVDFSALCAKGCTSGAAGCFPIFPIDCSGGQNVCDVAYPPAGTTHCDTANTRRCQIQLQFKPCANEAACPYKGFRCLPFPSSSSPNYCLPFEDAAVTACIVAHP